MASLKLTAEQQNNWQKLQTTIQAANIRLGELDKLQAVIREFALDIIKAQAEQDGIFIGGRKGHILMTFPNGKFKTKKAFISYHKQNGAWGDDAILYSALHALGYQPTMHLQDTYLPAYIPFESDSGLIIDVVNHGAKSEGIHWELQGEQNPGAGNCMYYMIAQQVRRDFTKIFPKAEAAEEEGYKNDIASQECSHEKSNEEVVKEVTKKFKKIEEKANKHYEEAYAKLTELNTETLIEIYHYAVKNLVGEDTYLKNRLKYITAEQGNDYVENVIKRKTPISDKEVNIRAELLHMLAKEAWRNPEAYKELMAKSFTEEQRFYPSKAEFFTSSGSDSSHKKVDKRSEVYHGVEPQVEIKV